MGRTCRRGKKGEIVRIKTIAAAASAAFVLLAVTATGAAAATLGAPGTAGVRHACPAVARPGYAECLALVRTDVASHQGIVPGLTPAGFSPASLRSAYNLTHASAVAGRGQTVAIVDAYDDPNAASDLAVYRSQYGLPACTTASGCFEKVNQTGGSTYPAANADWAEEESLDLDMVSAICPNCHIRLVEATSTSDADLGIAVNEAVSLGARFVSNSYGGPESSTELADEAAYYDHPGVAVTVSAGDSGYAVEFPAASQYVTAVGGTSLSRNSAVARGWSETVWGDGSLSSATGGTGSGCSAYEPKPAWQTDTGCSDRTVADVSADADPSTGVAVYDNYGGDPGWEEFGGTSVASPIIAAVYALAGTPLTGTYPASDIYKHFRHVYDVTSGSNGTCSPDYLCTGEVGYDGPTGLGTPDGTGAFQWVDNTVTITNPGTRTSKHGVKITPLKIKASDSAAAQTLTYTATGLPAGLSIASSTGIISGKPTTTGTKTVTVTATDGTGAWASVKFTWHIT